LTWGRAFKELLAQAIKAEQSSKTIWKRVLRASLDEEQIEELTLKLDEAYKEFQVRVVWNVG
jgi:hypothetical protein